MMPRLHKPNIKCEALQFSIINVNYTINFLVFELLRPEP
jgi:hypothetical protein